MENKKKSRRSVFLPLLLLLAATAYAAIRFFPLLSRYCVLVEDQYESAPPAGDDVHAHLELIAQKLSLVRDPFVSVPVVPVSNSKAAGVEIKGIFWDAGKPMAIINETVVRVGDVISNMTVIDIQKDRIVLQSGGEYLEFRVSAGQ